MQVYLLEQRYAGNESTGSSTKTIGLFRDVWEAESVAANLNDIVKNGYENSLPTVALLYEIHPSVMQKIREHDKFGWWATKDYDYEVSKQPLTVQDK